LGFWSLITVLLLSSGPAYAEWVLVTGDESGTTVYIDPSTIRRKDALVGLWTLYDSKTVETIPEGSFLSIKRQKEYDCAEERSRTLAETLFSGNMGKGKVVLINTAERSKWQPVQPGSIAQILWKHACGKK
jgi:hypothetical protein